MEKSGRTTLEKYYSTRGLCSSPCHFLLKASMEEKKKRYCNSCCEDVETVETLIEDGPHYSFHTCVVCGKHCGFGKKPENKNKRAKNKFTAADLKINHCQMCLRPVTRLGSRGVLEVHHVDEVNGGGADVPENAWVLCTSCHKLVHHQRLYLNKHLTCHYSITDLQADMDRYSVPEESQVIMRRIFKKQGEDNARNDS